MEVSKDIQAIFSQSPMNFLGWCAENLKHGFLDMMGLQYFSTTPRWRMLWRLSKGTSFADRKIGIVYDFVEFQRAYFNFNNIENRTFFLIDNTKNVSHAFSVFALDIDGKKTWYWFENEWLVFTGIRKIKTAKSPLDLVKLQLQAFKSFYDAKDIHCWEYFEPKEDSVDFSLFYKNITENGVSLF